MENEYRKIKKQADYLRKQKDYQKAVENYQELINNYPQLCNKWDKWGLAFSLYKLKRYEESLEICAEIYKKEKNFEANNKIYAWNLYHTKLNNNSDDIKSFLKTAELILELSEEKTNFSPYNHTIFKVLDKLNDFGNRYLNTMKTWILKLDKEFLSTKTYSFTNKFGKKIEIASEKEKYYMYKIQITFFKKEYQQCIFVCKEALETLAEFHYNNDIWFKRRMALSYAKTGKYNNAITLFKEIFQRKQDWFLLGELGEIYFAMNNFEKAKKYFLKAVFSPGEFDKKVNLFKILSDLYQKENNHKTTMKLYNLMYLIRLKNHWKIPSFLKNLPQADNLDYQTEKKEVLKLLKEEYAKLEPYHTGVITKIFPHGKSGFIKDEKDGSSYYFFVKEISNSRHPSEYDTVKFHLREGFDKKKNRKVMNAVEIEIIK